MTPEQLLEAIKGYGADDSVLTIGKLKRILEDIILKNNKPYNNGKDK